MPVICDLALALSLTLSGACEEKSADFELPSEDAEAWAYNPPEVIVEPVIAEPPAPIKPKVVVIQAPPEEKPQFKPIVITKIVEKTVEPVVTLEEKRQQQKEQEKAEAKAQEEEIQTQLQSERDKVRDWILSQRTQELRPVNPIQVASLNTGTVQTNDLTAPSLASVNAVDDLEKSNSQEEYDYGKKLSSLPVDNARIFAADRYITGIVETGVNSQLDSDSGGEVIIQTARDVYGYHGRNKLIPKGSRMICSFDGADDVGSTRLAIICKRILLGGHRAEIIQLQTRLTDVQGNGGVPGDVDNRFFEKYGTAFILAGISSSVRLATAFSNGQAQTSTDQALEAGSQELSQRLGEISASVIENTINLKPIISIHQGDRVQLRPMNDWYLQEVKS